MSAAHLPTRVFPVPYQVEFISETKGRHIDATKRQLTWKFGFVDPPAVFPHLLGGAAGADDGARTGIACRGREHEIMITWSVLTSKVHIYVDSKEIYRHVPYHNESILYTFNGMMHRAFDLPNAEFNGQHRIDVRLYARTPMGAKNMVVDENGGRFRQFDLAVDGLSYFSMPAVFELGTAGMWDKVSRWDRARLAEDGARSSRSAPGRALSTEDGERFSRASSVRRGGFQHDDWASPPDDIQAMEPRSESDEARMTRLATEASLRDWDKRVGYGKTSRGDTRSGGDVGGRPSSQGQRPRSGSHRAEKRSSANNLTAIGEDNLIDFAADDVASGVPHIDIHERHFSDVSVMDDDDATTASFMMNTAMPTQQPPPMGHVYNSQPPPMRHTYSGHQPPPSQFAGPDPTFRAQYAQQPWSSVGTLSTPRGRPGGVPPGDASFAVPPAPTLDDYEDAFGGGSAAVNPMSPASSASVGMGSPTPQHHAAQQYGTQQASQQYGVQQAAPQYGVQQVAPQYGMQQAAPQYGVQQAAQQYGMQQAVQQHGMQQAAAHMAPQQQWSSPSFGAPGPGKSNAFDPF